MRVTKCDGGTRMMTPKTALLLTARSYQLILIQTNCQVIAHVCTYSSEREGFAKSDSILTVTEWKKIESDKEGGGYIRRGWDKLQYGAFLLWLFLDHFFFFFFFFFLFFFPFCVNYLLIFSPPEINSSDKIREGFVYIDVVLR
eukprot:TRINITY_DN1640_c0_g5_i1.p1 TRINITY_DN1640_c0_g5~~TRINITY_DN1640_c0_g5_i1.p1  ORF type:complete len:143 (+),score=26.76 TRINITY_DN1640_c0_g5_i1:185-613(+)